MNGPRRPTATKAAVRPGVSIAKTADERARTTALFGGESIPEVAPFFTRFVAGYGGEMWVQEFDEDLAASQRFVIFDQHAMAVARVTLPTAMRVDDVGKDYILGIQTDARGVETVVEYQLVRG